MTPTASSTSSTGPVTGPVTGRRGLRRRLRRIAGMTLLEIIIVLAILALVMGLLVGPQVLKMFGESKTDIARATVKKMAFEAYSQWVSRPGNAGKCPTPANLGEYMATANPKDPWGEEYVIKCSDLPAGAVGIAVLSKGEDKREGTGDDIKSWDQ